MNADNSTISRRDFLKTCATATAGGSLLSNSSLQVDFKALKKPNIIFILTDQQSATMMSCTGNPWLNTPAMDYIAENGIRFERAYATNPVCSPVRISFMTGRFPGYFSSDEKGPARENKSAMAVSKLPEEVVDTHIGAYLEKGGYELAYGGKEHLPGVLSPKELGFDLLTSDQRDGLAETCANFIKQSHDRPYFLWANFINPHDICYVAINDVRYYDQTIDDPKPNTDEQNLIDIMTLDDGIPEEEFFRDHCPPLPGNYLPQTDEPMAVTELIELRSFRKIARDTYTDKDWRFHRWVYHRLTEQVDRKIQILLDALKESGQEENTVVILSSDHGDMDASHKMEHKTAFYEESARIPFVVMHKAAAPGGRVDDEHLVSNGLDLLPTVCDYAGIPDAKADHRGRSLRPLIERKAVKNWRQTLGVESEIGRMVVGDRVKYIKYDFAGIEEQLLDLTIDPGETEHFTDDPGHAEMLEQLRASYNEQWFPGT